jgi:S1-C subfamily serine protease
MITNKNNKTSPARKAMLALVAVLVISMACINIPFEFQVEETAPPVEEPAPPPGQAATQEAIPTLTLPPGNNRNGLEETPPATTPEPSDDLGAIIPATGFNMIELFREVNPGVVSIQVYIGQGLSPAGTGSGFVLDEDGHIITNRHVVARGQLTTVVFYNGVEIQAEVIGVDADSDLAVLRVEQFPDGILPLPLGNSDEVIVGETVIAIGNPFGLASSMTVGIVSAVGRSIPTGVTPFRIPQAIQTDAAINPGNSGGPLLNIFGEVIGVNAQIATTGGVPGNVGVGFAIPSNTVRRVAPVLIETGTYHWPYLGVTGTSVTLPVQRANDLPIQKGYYITSVVENSPAERAGLRGATGSTSISGLSGLPVGGDVILTADGVEIFDTSDLLVAIASHMPGEIMEMTIYRDGQEMQVTAELAPRQNDFEDQP